MFLLLFILLIIIIISIRRLVFVVYETHALIVADVTHSTGVGLSNDGQRVALHSYYIPICYNHVVIIFPTTYKALLLLLQENTANHR